MQYSTLISNVENHVINLFENITNEKFLYHDLIHTQAVVKRAKLIAENCKLNENENAIVITAAWFHDTGYIFTTIEHEEESCRLAKKFLIENQAEHDFITNVEKCIKSTKFPQIPQSELSKVMCDADMSHLAHPDFFEISLLLRKEQNLLVGRKKTKLEYWLETIKVFENHSYFTNYGKTVLQEEKAKNYEKLKKKITKAQQKKEIEDSGVDDKVLSKAINDLSDKLDKERKNHKKKEEVYNDKVMKLEEKLNSLKVPVRGIETMFRVAGRNQISLSAIADNKANMLISVNAIVISVVASSLLINYESNNYIVLPAIVLLFVSLVTIIFAILATRPNVSHGKFTKEDVKNKTVNLLFFGNFFNMQLPDYEYGVKEMMNDYQYLYDTLIRDQYYLGVVLAKKYRLLRVTYSFFMVGLIISVLSFVVSIIYFG